MALRTLIVRTRHTERLMTKCAINPRMAARDRHPITAIPKFRTASKAADANNVCAKSSWLDAIETGEKDHKS